MNYDLLLSTWGPAVYERDMPLSIKGLYSNNVIWINRSISTVTEKTCILAEELGHHYTSSGDILDQSDVRNRKQEIRARRWAYEEIVPISAFVQAHKQAIRNRHELAALLDVTEEFLQAAIEYYIDKYGLSVQIDNYTVIFEPLGVLELFDTDY